MFNTRSLKSGLFGACLAVAGGFALLSPAQEALAGDAGPVKCDTLNNANLKAYCTKNEGKRAKIKAVMKKTQVAYKEAGTDVKCVTCHETGDGGAIKKSESEKHWKAFEPLLNAELAKAK